MTAAAPTTLTLDPESWLDDPEPVLSDLRGAQDVGVLIDAEMAGAVPAQIAQLLVAAQRTAGEKGTPFAIQNPSEAVQTSLETLGLAKTLLKEEA